MTLYHAVAKVQLTTQSLQHVGLSSQVVIVSNLKICMRNEETIDGETSSEAYTAEGICLCTWKNGQFFKETANLV